jgi:phage tail protein X
MTADNIEVFEVRGDRMTVDLLLWQRYRRDTKDLLERVLDMNPGLADYGAFIPDGVKVYVPIDKPKSQPVLKLVKLWD